MKTTTIALDSGPLLCGFVARLFRCDSVHGLVPDDCHHISHNADARQTVAHIESIFFRLTSEVPRRGQDVLHDSNKPVLVMTLKTTMINGLEESV